MYPAPDSHPFRVFVDAEAGFVYVAILVRTDAATVSWRWEIPQGLCDAMGAAACAHWVLGYYWDHHPELAVAVNATLVGRHLTVRIGGVLTPR